jgi:hypothetical protein
MSFKDLYAGARLGGHAILILGLVATMLVTVTPSAWAASIQISPTSGPAGASVGVMGTGWNSQACVITISFIDANGVITTLKQLPPTSSFNTSVSVPGGAAMGPGTIRTVQFRIGPGGCRPFWGVVSSTFTVLAVGVVGNPGFENGSSNPEPWVVAGARINDVSTEPPHTGSWDAWLGGLGTTHSDSIYQDIAIPSGVTSATLGFWLHIDTADTGASPHDVMRVRIRSSSGGVFILATYSNLDAGSGYAEESLSLTSFAGQTVRLFLGSNEDGSLQTSFVVDDFALTTT